MEKEIKYNEESVKSVFDRSPEIESILITSDENIFLTDKVSESYCKQHCVATKSTYKTLTRNEFEGKSVLKSKKDTVKTPATEPATEPVKGLLEKTKQHIEDSSSWKDGKMSEIIEFATSEGMVLEKKVGQSKAQLIELVEAFLANKAVGATPVTNHETQD